MVSPQEIIREDHAAVAQARGEKRDVESELARECGRTRQSKRESKRAQSS